MSREENEEKVKKPKKAPKKTSDNEDNEEAKPKGKKTPKKSESKENVEEENEEKVKKPKKAPKKTSDNEDNEEAKPKGKKTPKKSESKENVEEENEEKVKKPKKAPKKTSDNEDNEEAKPKGKKTPKKSESKENVEEENEEKVKKPKKAPKKTSDNEDNEEAKPKGKKTPKKSESKENVEEENEEKVKKPKKAPKKSDSKEKVEEDNEEAKPKGKKAPKKTSDGDDEENEEKVKKPKKASKKSEAKEEEAVKPKGKKAPKKASDDDEDNEEKVKPKPKKAPKKSESKEKVEEDDEEAVKPKGKKAPKKTSDNEEDNEDNSKPKAKKAPKKTNSKSKSKKSQKNSSENEEESKSFKNRDEEESTSKKSQRAKKPPLPKGEEDSVSEKRLSKKRPPKRGGKVRLSDTSSAEVSADDEKKNARNIKNSKSHQSFIEQRHEDDMTKSKLKRDTRSVSMFPPQSQPPSGENKIISTKKSKTQSDERLEEIYGEIEKEDAEIEVVYQFNSNPKKNIGQLCKFFDKDESPESIAYLMHHVEGLVGEVIGDYLSRKENGEILHAFFNAIDLKTDFIEAMRRSLSGPLYLPGEAQQIDRVVQAFSQCYMEQNPGAFNNDENPYILSFALIMLNSDLHNPNVQRRMTCQQFIKNTKGSLNNDDISDEELTKMYNALKENPFKFSNSSNEFMALSAPSLKGYLQVKMAKKFTKFSKKYFVLANSCMYYFKDDSQLSKDQPQGMIQLTEVEVTMEKGSDNVILVTTTGSQIQNVCFEKGIPNMIPNVKKVYFKTTDNDTCMKWFIRMRKSVIISSFQDGNPNDEFNAENVSDA
ncbi:Sec7 domain containing protein [Histomonas meleagridis]|uniref:Sec7 domain containing protein n=1 Tax=Histomonas meleagridis TaxID=135588 RepID=UPI0035598F68|nr:Sec7 domain containing protein [Histomonas meleagridis]